MSVRTSTVGPLPFSKTPTTPVPPTFSVTSKPSSVSSRGQPRGRLDLAQRQFRVGVQVLVEGFQAADSAAMHFWTGDAVLDGFWPASRRAARAGPPAWARTGTAEGGQASTEKGKRTTADRDVG